MVNFLAKRPGAYLFAWSASSRAGSRRSATRSRTRTKPHFAGTEKGPDVNRPELLHELAHQWMGDDVTGRTWQQIWFNEGWATFAEVYWGAKVNDLGQSPPQFFRRVLEIDKKEYRRPPADLGSPLHLFDAVPVYNRPWGDDRGLPRDRRRPSFFAFARKLTGQHRYGTISEGEFVKAAKRGEYSAAAVSGGSAATSASGCTGASTSCASPPPTSAEERTTCATAAGPGLRILSRRCNAPRSQVQTC